MAELKIKADSGGGTVSFKGPATTTSNAAVQLTLPVDDGTANQYLKTDGSGALSWATVDTSIADDSIVEAKLDVSNAPTNGQFLQAQSGEGGGLTWAAAGGGIENISVYQCGQISADAGDGEDITANWSEYTTANYGNQLISKLGSSVTESSGIFSFPSTGHWQISHYLGGYNQNTESRGNGIRIYFSQNGSSYTTVAESMWNAWDASGTDNGVNYGSAYCSVIVNVTSTSTCKAKFWYQTEEGTLLSGGNANQAVFVRLADV